MTSIERGGVTQSFSYDVRGRLASSFKSGGEQLVRFSYDEEGTVFVADNLGTNRLYYNESGQLAKVMDPLGNITASVFDSDFRLAKLVLPTGENQNFAWTKAGNLTSVKDELGNATSFAYDDTFNRLASFTDAKANTTRYTYDPKGNLLSTIYPNNSVERFADYDNAGLPLSYTNRRGQPLTYFYNATGQITNQIFTDGSSNRFAYDARGNLTNVTEFTLFGTNKLTSYTYNYSGDGDRLKRVTYPNGRFLNYTYDNFGRRIQMTDQDGFATKYEYDSAGRLWKLRDETNTLLVTYAYDPSGRLSRIDKANGTFTTYDYDVAGQLLSLQNHRNATILNSRFDYSYDRRGRRTSMGTLDGDWTYGYDAIGQLTHAVFASANTNIPNQDLTYEYDALGNRVRTIENGVTNIYVANNLNQYTSVQGTNFQYDADGNLNFDGVNTYDWDEQNRLIQVTGPGGLTKYEYSAFGYRDSTIQDGQRTDFLFDPRVLSDVTAEYQQGGSRRANVHGLGLVCRTENGAARSFLDYDAIGSTVGLTGNTGNPMNQYAWEPFGKSISNSETTFNSFKFVGEFGVSSDSTGLMNMRSRDYLATIGRYLNADSIGLSGADANMQRYAYNNPTTLIDPIGRAAYTYNQATGEFSTSDRASIQGSANTFGYSGTRGGRNNPYAQHSPDYGPIPIGTYTVGPTSNHKGPFSHHLIPDAETRRNFPPNRIPDSFWIHGNNRANDASLGCIIIGNYYRQQLHEGDTVTVIPGLPPNDETIAETVSSQDPNQKLGPIGFGSLNHLSGGKVLPYRIKFENFGPGTINGSGTPLPSGAWASAPAQEVEITDQLSTNLDWSTFRFTGFGFGDNIVGLEQPTPSYQTVLPVTINGASYDVHVEVSLNLATGRVRAVFRSIDPATSLPPSVLNGFLPPEDGTGIGQGFIEYTVAPRTGLSTGTQIRNVALITFDRQTSISTDQIDPTNPSLGVDATKQALVTIDSGPPASSVQPLPAQSGRSFILSWSGQDDAGGSGIASYDLFVSTNGGPFSFWFQTANEGATMFQGELGKTYSFYSIAHDNVGNTETAPATPDAQTTIITNAPLLVTVSNATIDPGSNLSVTNLVQGSAVGTFLFSLASGPAGVSVNPTNGILNWTPDCAQGNTTNAVSVWVTDSARTNISDMTTFLVAVSKCVEPSLGEVVLLAGTSGKVPMNLIAKAALTNFQATLISTPGRLLDFSIEPIVSNICATSVSPLSNQWYRLEFSTCTNQFLTGTQQVAWLHFTAADLASAFVPLSLTNLSGFESNGTPIASFAPQSGRVVVVSDEPLMECVRNTNGQPLLLLYGKVAPGYSIETRTNFTVSTWQTTLSNLTLTNLVAAITPPASVSPANFYRAKRVGSISPSRITAVLLAGKTNVMFVVRGLANHSYNIETTTNLSAPSWQTAGSVTCDSDGLGRFTNTVTAMPKEQFYRVFTSD